MVPGSARMCRRTLSWSSSWIIRSLPVGDFVQRRHDRVRQPWSSLLLGWLVDGVVDEEVDEAVEVAEPAAPAGVVGQLGVDEAGRYGDDAVDVALARDACVVQEGDEAGEDLVRQRIRLG